MCFTGWGIFFPYTTGLWAGSMDVPTVKVVRQLRKVDEGVRREEELRGWTKVKHTPQTTNLIESYNQHLKSRVKPLQGFQNHKQAGPLD